MFRYPATSLLLAVLATASACAGAAPPSPTPAPAGPATPRPTASTPSRPTAAATATASPTPTSAPTPAATPQPAEASAGEVGTVVWVIDGDTIEVEIQGQVQRVRYIGIDAPEANEPGYEEARRANARLVSGREVHLERDVSETDEYGRLLRYVYAGSRLVNEELIEQGWARTLTIPPDVRHADRFAELQRQAQYAGVGLWGR